MSTDPRGRQSGRPGISRRSLLRGAGLLTLGGLGATACGSPLVTGLTGAGPATRSLTYWNPFGGGDGVRMIEMQDAYVKAHPEIDLTPVTLTWGAPYYTKLSLATLGDSPPDIAIAHLDRYPTFAEADLLEPLDTEVLARHGITEDKFTPAAWQQSHVGDTLYALPLDTHPWVLYYHKDVCKKAGLLDADGALKNLDGRDALADAMAAAKKVTGQYGGVSATIADPATCWREFSTLYWQLGGNDILADDGARIVLDDDKAVQALTYQAELTVEKKVMPDIDYPGAITAFSTGKAGFYFQGPWEVTTFLTSKTPFGMTTFPQVFDEYVVWADSHAFVLPKDSSRDPQRRDLILQYAKFLLENSLTWAQGGHVPAWLPIQESKEYRELDPQSSYTRAAYAARYDPPAWYSGAGSNFENAFGDPVAGLKAGRLEPEQAVRAIRRNLAEFANTPPPVG
ncbi:MAG: extracellular solute-binding protein [Streptosporangiales bacterium]|nr:extracellular solute-binding protein [Streptosporangiales bacterium]